MNITTLYREDQGMTLKLEGAIVDRDGSVHVFEGAIQGYKTGNAILDFSGVTDCSPSIVNAAIQGRRALEQRGHKLIFLRAPEVLKECELADFFIFCDTVEQARAVALAP